MTQSNIHSTICVSGYTDRIRPPTSYTDPLKYRLMSAYGSGNRSASAFELDHLISLELGGAPSDPRNLFPEPYAGSRGASAKDGLENSLHDQVCAGAMSLARAQHEILDWVKYAAPTEGAPSESRSKDHGSPSSAPASHAHGSGCDPNYSGACLDPNASDYDCAGGGGDGPKYVQGPVRVVGTDHFQLDSNGDGVGCE